MLGEAAGLFFREDRGAVDDHVELADFTRLDRDVDAGLFLDLGRETRGLGFVASDDAVLDRDVHRVLRPWPWACKDARGARGA